MLKNTLLSAVLLLTASVAQAEVPVYGFEVVNTYPHRTDAFTQGLEFNGGYLYEGTGRNGRSSLSRIDWEQGAVLQSIRLPSRYFGEGISIVGERIFQLTWQSNIVFVYDLNTFETITSHYHPTEGWGLAWDGTHLILSDGTAALQFIEPETFQVVRKVPVTLDGTPVNYLNELEYINGEVWANVWQTDEIVRIDPATGHVTALVDLQGLSAQTQTGGPDAVLNGIAWLAQEGSTDGRLFVTGKLWGNLFEITLQPRE
jgi:glutamine cyclotransferase